MLTRFKQMQDNSHSAIVEKRDSIVGKREERYRIAQEEEEKKAGLLPKIVAVNRRNLMASNMQSSLKISRSFWEWRYSSEYLLSGKIDQDGLSKLVDQCLNHLLPQQLFISNQIEDIKGFDRKPLGGEELPLNDRGVLEELVYVAGHIREIEEEKEEDTEEAGSGESTVRVVPFALSLITSFKEFKGYQHIVHDVSLSRHTDSLEPIDLRTVGSTPNVELSHFRAGLEFFQNRYFAMLGVSPIADQRFSIEATSTHFNLSIVAESLKNKQVLPLTKDRFFEKLSLLFNELFGFDLKADYLELADPKPM
jgi:hypothetical protein